VFSLTTTRVRPTAEGSCQGERSLAKGRDDNYELYVYGGHVGFVDKSCYSGPVNLNCTRVILNVERGMKSGGGGKLTG